MGVEEVDIAAVTGGERERARLGARGIHRLVSVRELAGNEET